MQRRLRDYAPLAEMLPEDFTNWSHQRQCLHVIGNQRALLPFLLNNWILGGRFLEHIIGDNSDLRARILADQNFRAIFQLNQLRRAIIPDAARQRIPAQQQQHIVMELLRRRRQPPQPPVDVPQLQEGVLTKKIGDKDLAGELDIPDDLICPLSGGLFKEPVMVNQNGVDFYFEKSFILLALKQKKENPLNRSPLTEKDLKPAPAKAAAVVQFKKDCAKKFKEEEEKEAIAAEKAKTSKPATSAPKTTKHEKKAAKPKSGKKPVAQKESQEDIQRREIIAALWAECMRYLNHLVAHDKTANIRTHNGTIIARSRDRKIQTKMDGLVILLERLNTANNSSFGPESALRMFDIQFNTTWKDAADRDMQPIKNILKQDRSTATKHFFKTVGYYLSLKQAKSLLPEGEQVKHRIKQTLAQHAKLFRNTSDAKSPDQKKKHAKKHL